MTAAAIKTRPAAAAPSGLAVATRYAVIIAGATGIVLFSIGVTPQMLVTSYRPHLPDFSVFAGIPLILSVHIAAAVAALLIGLVIMARPKGRGLHKALGWSWVVAMAVTAVSSFGLLLLPGVNMSLIHGLSGYVMIALPIGIAAIRRRDIKTHRGTMTGLFIGGLMTAAVLTLLPGRLMWRVFFG